MAHPALDIFDVLPVVRSYHCRFRGSVASPKLDDEIVGQVFRLGLAPFLAPEAEQSGLVVPHDDPGVGAADEATTALI